MTLGGEDHSEVDRLTRAVKKVEQFTRRARELIKNISVKDLIEEGGLNPYMVAALHVSSFEDVAELFVYRRVERSLGTSFGSVIEDLLRELLGGKKGSDMNEKCRERRKEETGGRPWICWWDIVLEDKRVVISVKSGPADINKDIVDMFIQKAREAEINGYKPYLVLTYGKQAFQVAESTLRSKGMNPEEYILVGRAVFKKFINNDIYNELIDKIYDVASGIDIFNLIDQKAKEIADELKRKYRSVPDLLKDLS